jgi:mannose-6-phosphate isomerase
MAVALSKFSGFCGFLPVRTVAEYLSFVPELSALVSPHIAEAFRVAVNQPHPLTESIQSTLKDVFSALMYAEAAAVKEQVHSLVRRYQEGKAKEVEFGVKDLALELHKQYPYDVGILCVFLLNVVNLEAGQAMFLQANEPHAYIHGGKLFMENP